MIIMTNWKIKYALNAFFISVMVIAIVVSFVTEKAF